MCSISRRFVRGGTQALAGWSSQAVVGFQPKAWVMTASIAEMIDLVRRNGRGRPSKSGRQFVARVSRAIRNFRQYGLQIAGLGALRALPEKLRSGLDGTDLLRHGSRYPLIERYTVLLGQPCGSGLDRG